MVPDIHQVSLWFKGHHGGNSSICYMPVCWPNTQKIGYRFCNQLILYKNPLVKEGPLLFEGTSQYNILQVVHSHLIGKYYRL